MMEQQDLDQLILYRLDELKTGQDALRKEQLSQKQKLNDLSIRTEHRISVLETKSTIRGAVSGAVSSLIIALAGAIIWLTQNL